MTLPRIIITAGEPAGIGPDLVVKLAQRSWPAQLVVCADPALLLHRAQQLGMPLEIQLYDAQHNTQHKPECLVVAPLQLANSVEAGQLNSNNSAYVLESLTYAGLQMIHKKFDALVTGPVQKSIINDAGIPFSGHTEFFAQQAQCQRVVMMLATAHLRVALATTHLPLRQVADAITPTCLTEVIQILHQDLIHKYGIKQPRIYVCGLNPHAGEQGHLGLEEQEVIEPTLEALRQQGLDLQGPLPADTLFQPKYLEHADAVLAMYHDQGLPVLKSQGFGAAMNITLGLPYIRTSVDHGTALDLAGTGKADVNSFIYAVESAIKLSQKHYEQ